MFNFEKIDNKKVLKSDFILNSLFTTRDCLIKTKNETKLKIANSNKESIKNFLNLNKIISPQQTHTSNISVVQKDINEYPNTDALILTEKNIGIALNFADCTPLIFYDKVKNIGAIAHAGWRGTVGKIGVKTVLKMQKDFGCRAKDIVAVVGPCISKCCFEVGVDVYKQLSETVAEPLYCVKSTSQDKVFVDLKEINAKQLRETGVEKIDICPYCTVCDNDLFFSYRKENGTTDRHSALLWLEN